MELVLEEASGIDRILEKGWAGGGDTAGGVGPGQGWDWSAALQHVGHHEYLSSRGVHGPEPVEPWEPNN